MECRYAEPGKYFNQQLFWSSSDQSFRVLKFMVRTDTTSVAENIDRYMRSIDYEFELYQFVRHKYYGYPGWDWDIINEPVIESKMNDTAWESLARAYTNYASGFIVEQYGDVFINDDKDREQIVPGNAINEARRDKFIFYELKGIDAYKKLATKYPLYETRVGNILLKCANEYLFMYSDLMMAGDSISARKYVALANYPDSILNLYHAYLKDLPKNSIVITGGDNDTYVMWYLQAVQNFRSDITVINYSLLGLRQYIYYLDRIFNKKLFMTRDSVYRKPNFDYAYFSGKDDGNLKLPVSQFLTGLNKNKEPEESSEHLNHGEPVRRFVCNAVYFENRKAKMSSHIGETKIISLPSIIFMNEFMLLDIVSTNSKRRIFTTFSIDLLSAVMVQNRMGFEIKPFED